MSCVKNKGSGKEVRGKINMDEFNEFNSNNE